LRKTPKDRSPEEMAIVKQRGDEDQFNQNEYDYEDDEDTYRW